MSFGKGLKRSHPNKLAARVPLAQHPRVAMLLSTMLPPSASLAADLPPVFDQGSTGSCTWHSTPGALVTVYAAADKPLGFIPSMREGYATTRAYERALTTPLGTNLPALTDSGAEIADVITCLAHYGVEPMGPDDGGRLSDIGPDNVNAEPDLGGLEISGQKLIVGPYLVDPTSSTASDTLAAAIVVGIPIVIGFFCDTAFENLQAGQVAGAPDQNDPNGGGHAVFLYGYSGTAGSRIFNLRNSWGTSFCDRGDCLVSEAWLNAAWEAFPMVVST